MFLFMFMTQSVHVNRDMLSLLDQAIYVCVVTFVSTAVLPAELQDSLDSVRRD